ncbi:MAG: HAD family hydrolase [Pirellulales bacterium]
MPIRGVIFDLDGTLVDSRLDFDQMRREMGIDGSPPLLEALANMPPERATRCWEILLEHERRGAEQAVPFPGVPQFLQELAERGLARGVVTRNSRESTLALLARLGLQFDPVLGRHEAPPKPDPTALLHICQAWDFAPRECVMIGDYRYDIEAARRAGMHAVLFTGAGGLSGLAEENTVDLLLSSFAEPAEFWQWLGQIDLGGDEGSC